MDTDVIVVGSGPTGLLLACELALAGVRTLVVERRTEPQQDSRALTLHPRSLELMDLRGLAPRFLGLGRTLPGWHFAALETPLDFAALDSRLAHTLFLAQARTEELLAQRAQELGVEIRRGHTLTGLRQGEDGVEAEVRGPQDGPGGGARAARGGPSPRPPPPRGARARGRGVADGGGAPAGGGGGRPGHGPAGTPRTLRAAYLVGCDGGRSTVREAAGIDFPGTDETLTGVLGDFATVTAGPEALAAARGAGVLAVPLEGGLTRFVYIDPERMRTPAQVPVTLEEFRSALVRLCGSDFGVDRPSWLSRFGNATRLAAAYRSGRVLLAGDAAHIHFPAAGQGLNTGLQDAMNLGWKLAAEVRGWAPPGLLDTYHAERHPVGRAVTDNTEVQTLLAELPLVDRYRRPAAALRGLFEELLRMPEVNRRFAEQVSALGTAYPATAPGADPLVGRRMPDIALSAAGSDATRVYELLHRGGFVLLRLAGARDPNPEPYEAPARHPHISAVTARAYEEHPELDGVREVLVRPDGHIAWATRSADAGLRRTGRDAALTAWAVRSPA
ncbi:FAD-dependent monooxygenase [Streptomyces sp. NPDC059552]|uniref:FAD-dependent monooxygenase n=1 Tax=Streptomyces sp. NPDC059552 TaxID=3346862 RepID=UPI00369F887A